MQQTETYKLNLIETGDAFSPLPINESMEIIEGALQVLNGTIPKIKIGTYTGTGTVGSSNRITLSFDFAPKFVLVWCTTNFDLAIGTAGFDMVFTRHSSNGATPLPTTWGETFVHWYFDGTDSNLAYAQMNTSGRSYQYLVLG